MAQATAPQTARPRGPLLLWALIALVAVAVAAYFLLDDAPVPASPSADLDDDLCPIGMEGIGGSATFLVDLRKPVAGAPSPSDLLRDLSFDLAKDTELLAFAVTPNPSAPRQWLGRLCKPYDDAELTIGTAKDQSASQRDCDNLPAQVPRRLRELAEGFCERREALAERVQHMAERLPAAPVANAFLVEALEETRADLARRSPPQALFVLSDMLQHSAWYSQLQRDWMSWGFSEFAALGADREPPVGAWSGMGGARVKVFYLPRQGLTDALRRRRAHQGFWQAYFGDAAVTFEAAAPLPAFALVRLDDAAGEATEAAQAREALQQERLETERLLARLAVERTALEESLRGADAAPTPALPSTEAQASASALNTGDQDGAPAPAVPIVAAPPDSPPPDSPPAVAAAEPPAAAESEPVSGVAADTAAADPAAAAAAPGSPPAVAAAEPPAAAESEPVSGIAADTAAADPAASAAAPGSPPAVAAAEPPAAAESEPVSGIAADTAADDIAASAAAPDSPPVVAVEPPAVAQVEPLPDPAAAADPAVSTSPPLAPGAATLATLDAEQAPSRPDPRPEETAAPAAAAAAPSVAPCAIALKPRFAASLETDSFPGGRRVNYGAGVIAVGYTVNEEGATVNDEIVVLREGSSVTQAGYFDALASDAAAIVRDWEFDFAAGEGCAPVQRHTATFTYRNRCVSLPRPSCHTMRSDVAVL